MSEQLVWVLFFILVHTFVLLLLYLVLFAAAVFGVVLKDEFLGFLGSGRFENTLLLKVVVMMLVKGICDFFLLEKIRADWEVRERLMMAFDKIKL